LFAYEPLADNPFVPDHSDPSSAEALADNRSGKLTDEQVRTYQRIVSGRRRSTWGLALPVGAIGMLLLVLSGPEATTVKRHLAGWGFIAMVAVILVAPAFDPMAADVRTRRVATVEGALGKRRRQLNAPAGSTRYYLVVANHWLRTFRPAYEAAPDAGYVRAYYLPRTRRLVNLERLPNPPVPASADEARAMFGRMAQAFAARDANALAEARANAAGLADAAREIIDPTDAPRPLVAKGLVREALVGTWTHPIASVTFAENGTATVTTILGATRTGRWSVDAGRLLTDVTGTMETTAAALDGDHLTIQLEGRSITFTRAPGA